MHGAVDFNLIRSLDGVLSEDLDQPVLQTLVDSEFLGGSRGGTKRPKRSSVRFCVSNLWGPYGV